MKTLSDSPLLHVAVVFLLSGRDVHYREAYRAIAPRHARGALLGAAILLGLRQVL